MVLLIWSVTWAPVVMPTFALAVSRTLWPSPVIVAVSDSVPLVMRGWSTVTVLSNVTDPLFVAVNCTRRGRSSTCRRHSRR